MRTTLLLVLTGLVVQGAVPRYTALDALKAEFSRQPPRFSEKDLARLPKADLQRLELSLKRIGAPGAPALLPPELEKPSLEAWEAKAKSARTPQERFTALFFLNRLKSPKALEALKGLKPEDAKSWPKHLHLENLLATARINGAEPDGALQAFLTALERAGKVDPVRAQAARLRLLMAGKEKELRPAIPATPGSILALLDAWNRAPWEKRRALTLSGFKELNPESPVWSALGLQKPDPKLLQTACTGILSRMAEGTPDPAPTEILNMGGQPWPCATDPLGLWYGFQPLTRFAQLAPAQLGGLIAMLQQLPPHLQGSLLPALRKHAPGEADQLRTRLLEGSDPTARASAIEDLPEPPVDLEGLLTRLWKVAEYDGMQTLIPALERWKLPVEKRKGILLRCLDHPCWTARLDAWRELQKLDPAAAWPKAPELAADDKALLKEAEILLKKGRPVRLRLHLEGKRRITLKLNPLNAPLNVANLVSLTRKGFFNGRRIPRVVPDFVVQMGSPLDTMDGGPGTTMRCENSLDWYGPGSVGMALSGKDTGGCQFFITTNATPHLTGRYTRVGELEDPDKALPLLDALELGARIEKVEILGNPQ